MRGIRAGDLLNRDFTAPAPNRVWVTDFTYVRTWSPSWVYVAFIVDVYSQRILAWHASTSKATDLVLHGSLGMISPTEFETAHYATLTREPQPI